MLILRTPAEMQQWSATQRHAGRSIGFVPTMGALHDGHQTLLIASAAANDASVLSIFVNPTQFNVAEDFDNYPRTFESDVSIAKANNVEVVYAPTVDVMYPSGASVTVQPGTASLGMEGAMRPGHFAGVCTVVSKLFHAVLPDTAYFGKKDFQQLAVIKQMVVDLDFPVTIIGVNTVRAQDGLALSSRNVRLTKDNRVKAVSISSGLFEAKLAHDSGNHDSQQLRHIVSTSIDETSVGKIEYVEICEPLSLTPVTDTSRGAVICVAVWFGDVRLIDNIELAPS